MPSGGSWDQPQPNAIPQNVQNTGTSLTRWVNRPYSSWIATLTATIGNPTLGTGGSVATKFLQAGRRVFGFVFVQFGTAGAAAGNGVYQINTPITGTMLTPAATHGDPVGSGWLNGGLAMEHCIVTLYSPTIFRLKPSSAYLGFVTNNVPFAWANNMSIAFNFDYEAAP